MKRKIVLFGILFLISSKVSAVTIPSINSNIASNNSFNHYQMLGDSTLPEKFTLADVDGKMYSNDESKNQSSLGMCWAFASIGTVESNILVRGVNGLDEAISKCTVEEPDSRYCRLKEDYEINEKYKNREVSTNAAFSERNIDYIYAKPYDTGMYNSSLKNDAIKERYNPYTRNGNFGAPSWGHLQSTLYTYGLSPKRALKEWATYNTKNTTMTLEEVFDSVDTDYIVTNSYKYPDKPSTNIAEWQNGLKEMIMTYGSVTVNTYGPSYYHLGKCINYNPNDKSFTIYKDYNCGNAALGGHTMQIIGWDDNYDYSYCRTETGKMRTATKEECEEAGYKWLDGKGVWILKNSWGKGDTLYVNLAYASQFSFLEGIREVSVRDYDNTYNADISLIDTMKDNNSYIYKYHLPNDNEYLSRINIYMSVDDKNKSSNYKLFISKNGIDYSLIATDELDYTGIRSFKVNDYILDTNTLYVKLENTDNNVVVTKPTILTNNNCTHLDNCNDSITIKTYGQWPYIKKSDNIINIRTKTSNLKSGSKLDYKIYDSNNNDVTSNFDIKNNYVVTSNNIVKINFNDEIKTGKYTIKTIYNDIEDSYDFNIIDNDFITLYAKDDIYIADKTATIKYKVFNNEKISNLKWSVSDENVATITDGILNIKKHGTITVTLEATTNYGQFIATIEVTIYDGKITTPEEFLKIFEYENINKYYYITNDLDFNNIKYSTTSYSYYGILNGGYHTIKNVNSVGYNTAGIALFPELNGIVKNLKLEDSVFTNTSGNAGAIAGRASIGAKLENIQVENTKVSGTRYVGGLIGYISDNNTSFVSTCDKCSFAGTIEATSKSTDLTVGGIIGYTTKGIVRKSYNKGSINITISSDNKVLASGILNGPTSDKNIENCYNIGEIVVNSTIESATIVTNGLNATENAKVKNSYYLEDDNYTNNNDYSRTKERLLDKDNYVDWDFIDTWYMNNDYPILRTFPMEVTDINTDLFSNTLNTNSEYIFDLNVEPFGNKNNVQVDNLSQDLITIDNNKIITKNKEGTAKIKFTIDTYSFTKEYVIKELIKVSYDNNYTNNDLDITFDINYYKEEIKDGYLEFVYNNTNKKLDSINSLVKISIDENKDINYTLNYCKDSCIEVYSSSITINNIDKDKPTITYDYNKEKKELLINLEDAISGISDNNEYYIAIASNDTVIPSNMFEYVNNNIIKNIEMDYQKTYLWIKNISDNAGNKLCDSDYCVYNLNIPRDKYYVNYYDDDKETLIKKEEYLEDEKINVITYSKEDDMYYYEVIKWDGYKDNMIVKSNIDLYANYKKTSKYIVSEEYLVEDNYIKKILPSNIYNKYMYKDFISKISHSDGFELYEGINKIDNPSYIKTGMIYKNKYNSYKLVLVGDVNGDGYIKMNDIMMIANHLIDNNTLFNEYYYAGDLTGDNKVKMNDLMRLATTMINGGEL